MNYSEFVGQVQHRLELPGEGEALRATRAVLSTLGQRIMAGEADDLAASLPMEIDYYPRHVDHGERFDFDEFLDRVGEIARVDESDAFYHSQVVVALASEVVSGGEMDQVRDQLPEEFDRLFEVVDREREEKRAEASSEQSEGDGGQAGAESERTE